MIIVSLCHPYIYLLLSSCLFFAFICASLRLPRTSLSVLLRCLLILSPCVFIDAGRQDEKTALEALLLYLQQNSSLRLQCLCFDCLFLYLLPTVSICYFSVSVLLFISLCLCNFFCLCLFACAFNCVFALSRSRCLLPSVSFCLPLFISVSFYPFLSVSFSVSGCLRPAV